MLMSGKQSGVRISAADAFLDLTSVERVALLVASIQLCGAAISAIITDNPDDEEDIKELLNVLSIHPEDQALN